MDWSLKTVSSLPFKDTFSKPLPVKDGRHCGIDPVMLNHETVACTLKVAQFDLNQCTSAQMNGKITHPHKGHERGIVLLLLLISQRFVCFFLSFILRWHLLLFKMHVYTIWAISRNQQEILLGQLMLGMWIRITNDEYNFKNPVRNSVTLSQPVSQHFE